jgi:RIO-like serine/threonine protein kinase
MEYFNNEKNALKRLGRLIDVDEQNLILVMQKISGTTLKEVLRKIDESMTEDDQGSRETLKVLLQKYLRLPKEFRQKWRMAHMDVYPGNVIVDDNGDMHLINFAKTKELKGNAQENRLASNLDDLNAILGASVQFHFSVEEELLSKFEAAIHHYIPFEEDVVEKYENALDFDINDEEIEFEN